MEVQLPLRKKFNTDGGMIYGMPMVEMTILYNTS